MLLIIIMCQFILCIGKNKPMIDLKKKLLIYIPGSKVAQKPMVIGHHHQMVTPPLPQVNSGTSATAAAQYHYGFPNVSKVLPHKPTDALSVMSAPALVVTRQELMTSGSATKKPGHMVPQQPAAVVGMAPPVLNPQRGRGAPNGNLRLKQMELVDNHAVVFS